MILVGTRRRFESWEVIRARMMRETEYFVEEGLRHPEQLHWIPIIPVGMGTFTPRFASAFWSQVLATS